MGRWWIPGGTGGCCGAERGNGLARYAVYVEVGRDGRCMAHVPALPGCFVIAESREEALGRIPSAIVDAHAWLRRHGEPAPPAGEPVEVEAAGESVPGGPFGTGDTDALFGPDREPVTPAEMERQFRLMAHSRADLLELVRDLPEEILDWRPDPQSFSMRGLLRHVGNAEEWYVSRLVAPETLPAEWEHDEELPLFEFLEMERRTALTRLRELSVEERGGLFYPTQWTDYPEEPWTARKVLRRFLEHEREHTAQAREILGAYRDHLLASLAAERAGLLWQLVGLDERLLVEEPLFDEWTARDLLVHLAAWDRWEERTMKDLLAGGAADLAAVQDQDGFNAAAVAAWSGRTLADVLAELRAARADWVAWLRTVPLEAFFRCRPIGDLDWSFPICVEIQRQHDVEHALHLEVWRKSGELERSTGPRELLSASLAAARDELLGAAALVPPAARDSLPVCGSWTLKDVLAHVADWDWLGVEGLRHMAAGHPPQVEVVEEIDAWNQLHYEARRDEPWEAVWADFHAAREAMETVLAGMSQAGLERPFALPWGIVGTAYQWLDIYVVHDRDHARGLRESRERAPDA